ncbi:hypothetical protein BY996DRAFT_7956760, partial [Phakopsora pachyrhizi]
MNSLSWLLTPKTHQGSRTAQAHQPRTLIPTTIEPLDQRVDLGIGPRERESEWVDDMVDLVERRIGAEAANRLERKASMGLDGQLSSSSISSNQKALSRSISNQQSDGKPEGVDNLLIQPTSNITNSLSLNQAINNNSSKATTTNKTFWIVNFKWFRIRPSRQLFNRRNKTLVLDWMKTLIHSTSRLGGFGGVDPRGGVATGYNNGCAKTGRIVVYHVYKRPWVDFFLKTCGIRSVIFTASMREYADPVIDWFRSSPTSYELNQEGWLNDPKDEGLLELLPMLDSLRFTSD